MNIKEVIECRKKVRRPHWKPSYFIQAHMNGLFHNSEHHEGILQEHRMFQEDVLADDYEVYTISEDLVKSSIIRYLDHCLWNQELIVRDNPKLNANEEKINGDRRILNVLLNIKQKVQNDEIY